MNHKVSKISRVDVKLPESKGGLTVYIQCIRSLLRSFEMSFLRKIKDIQIKLTPWYIIRKHYITILGYNSKNSILVVGRS